MHPGALEKACSERLRKEGRYTNLESDGEHQHGENNRPKSPVPKHLQNTWHCHRCPKPSLGRHRNADRDGEQAGSRGREGGREPLLGDKGFGTGSRHARNLPPATPP